MMYVVLTPSFFFFPPFLFSLTAHEIRCFSEEFVPYFAKWLDDVKTAHRHADAKAVLGCAVSDDSVPRSFR